VPKAIGLDGLDDEAHQTLLGMLRQPLWRPATSAEPATQRA
jgi:hypothetical protein